MNGKNIIDLVSVNLKFTLALRKDKNKDTLGELSIIYHSNSSLNFVI